MKFSINNSVFGDRRYEVLLFQKRLVDIVQHPSTPDMSKVEMIDIVLDNVKDFITSRLIEINHSGLYMKISHVIYSILRDLDQELKNLITAYGIILDDDKLKHSEILYNQKLLNFYANETDHTKLSKLFHNLPSSNMNAMLYDEKYKNSNAHKPFCSFQTSTDLINIKVYMNEFKKCISEKRWNISDIIDPYTPVDSYYELLLKESSLMYRCPYSSYNHILAFIEEMCEREDLFTIFITLYRVNENSTIVFNLCKAASRGVKVFVYIEIKARGDEENNIKLVNTLVSYGVHAKIQYMDYKVHAKAFLAVTKDEKAFGHIATGNYNEETANQYVDTHLLTTDNLITENLIMFFIDLFETKPIFEKPNTKITYSPYQIQALFETYIHAVSKGRIPGPKRIWIKCNHLSDEIIEKALHEAAAQNVDVRLLIRTTCSMESTKHLQIRSKVGQFLEHDRIFLFGNVGFIGSCDLLHRNMHNRVENLCEVGDKQVEILERFFLDDWYSYLIHEKNLYGEWRLLTQ